MHDENINSTADETPPPAEPAESSAVGKVVRWARFGVGSRATIMLGMTMGVLAVTAAIPGYGSETVSIV